MKYAVFLLFYIVSSVAWASIVDYGPPQDSLGQWKFNWFDQTGTQVGILGNPLFFTTPAGAAATSALQTAENTTLTSILTASSSVPDSLKATYSGATVNGGIVNSPTDIFCISGSATKLVRVVRLAFTATQTTAAQRDVLIYKRTTANTAGTVITVPAIVHDVNDAAATASVKTYTANPTVGTSPGFFRARKVYIGAGGTNSDELILTFGDNDSKQFLLRGVAESMCVNLNGVTSVGLSADMSVTWTEE